MPCKRRRNDIKPVIPDFEEIMNFPLAVLVEDNYGGTQKMYMDAKLNLLPGKNVNENKNLNNLKKVKPKSKVRFSDEFNKSHDNSHIPEIYFSDKENVNIESLKTSKEINKTKTILKNASENYSTLTGQEREIRDVNSRNKNGTNKETFDLNELSTDVMLSSPLIRNKFNDRDKNPNISCHTDSINEDRTEKSDIGTRNKRKSILKNSIKDVNEENHNMRAPKFNVVFSSPLIRHTPNNRSDLRRQVLLDQLKQFKATPILSGKSRPVDSRIDNSLDLMKHSPTTSFKGIETKLPGDLTSSMRDYTVGPDERSFQVVKAEDRKRWIMEAKRRSRWIKRAQGMNDSFWEVFNVDDSESVILKICETQSIQTFAKIFPIKERKKIAKIGEGSFGEVFSIIDSENKMIVVKFIPVEGELYYNSGPQTTFDDILSEVVVSKELSDMNLGTLNRCKNFVQMKKVSLVSGKFPAYFQKEWDKGNKKKKSENDNPKKFGSNQKWIVIQFEFAGCPLEDFEIESWGQAYSILLQTSMALACAENYLEFEHRDLHWGNLLILKKDAQEPHDIFILDGKSYIINHHGIQSTIIDFTFSRIKKGINLVFTDMAKDEDIFMGTGDIQFDVYRSMQAYNQNQWATFTPKTNIFWLSYLSSKISTVLATKNLTTEESKAEFISFTNGIASCESANELIKHHLQ